MPRTRNDQVALEKHLPSSRPPGPFRNLYFVTSKKRRNLYLLLLKQSLAGSLGDLSVPIPIVLKFNKPVSARHEITWRSRWKSDIFRGAQVTIYLRLYDHPSELIRVKFSTPRCGWPVGHSGGPNPPGLGCAADLAFARVRYN